MGVPSPGGSDGLPLAAFRLLPMRAPSMGGEEDVVEGGGGGGCCCCCCCCLTMRVAVGTSGMPESECGTSGASERLEEEDEWEGGAWAGITRGGSCTIAVVGGKVVSGLRKSRTTNWTIRDSSLESASSWEERVFSSKALDASTCERRDSTSLERAFT